MVAEELPPNSHLRANATIFIEVLDVNEFNPEFNQTIYSAEVKENEAIGTSVLTVIILLLGSIYRVYKKRNTKYSWCSLRFEQQNVYVVHILS